jgi:hypothetical protein
MNDLTGSKILIGERILCNAVKDRYFTSKMKFEKLKWKLIRVDQCIVNGLRIILNFFDILLVQGNFQNTIYKLL